MSLISIEQGIFRSLENCLDEQFQSEWLIPKGFMKINPEAVESITFSPSFIVTPTRMKILEFLGQRMRRVVVKSELARELYKWSRWSSSETLFNRTNEKNHEFHGRKKTINAY